MQKTENKNLDANQKDGKWARGIWVEARLEFQILSFSAPSWLPWGKWWWRCEEGTRRSAETVLRWDWSARVDHFVSSWDRPPSLINHVETDMHESWKQTGFNGSKHADSQRGWHWGAQSQEGWAPFVASSRQVGLHALLSLTYIVACMTSYRNCSVTISPSVETLAENVLDMEMRSVIFLCVILML